MTARTFSTSSGPWRPRRTVSPSLVGSSGSIYHDGQDHYAFLTEAFRPDRSDRGARADRPRAWHRTSRRRLPRRFHPAPGASGSATRFRRSSFACTRRTGVEDRPKRRQHRDPCKRQRKAHRTTGKEQAVRAGTRTWRFVPVALALVEQRAPLRVLWSRLADAFHAGHALYYFVDSASRSATRTGVMVIDAGAFIVFRPPRW